MRKKLTSKVLSAVLACALVVTSANISLVANSKSADAKAKASLKLSSKKVSLKVGKTKTLKVTKKNVKKIKSTSWSTSKKSVATVSKKGKITAKKAGKATIKCTIKYIAKGSKKTSKKTLTCSVTVSKATTKPAATKKPVVSVKPVVTQTPSQLDYTPGPTADPTEEEVEVKGATEDEKVTLSSDGKEFELKDLVSGTVTRDNTTLKMRYDDTSNIADTSQTVTLKGTNITIEKKDNGSMRRDISAQYLQSTEMGLGINLGNTLEATYGVHGKLAVINGDDPTAYDKGWGQPEMTEEYFKTLHSYGINTLRIPVAWSNGDCDDGNYLIDEKLLSRVEQIANYALNQGMYVIINDHWDNQWWGMFGACKYGDDNVTKVPDLETRAEAWKKYKSYWTQIAYRFKDYSDHLILEGANEELGARLNDKISLYTKYCMSDAEISAWSGGKITKDRGVTGGLKGQEIVDTVNKINQTFVDIVRSTGGNNSYRFLLIPGYDTNIKMTCEEVEFNEDIDGDGKRDKYTIEEPVVMPTDVRCNGKNRLFLSIHYYTPWDFCGDGGKGTYTYQNQADLADELAPLKKFVDEGYAVIMGECGVCSPQTVDGSVPVWFEDTFAMCRKYNTVPVMWETGQLFDRKACKLKYSDLAVLFNAINVNAKGEYAQGDTSQTVTTGKPDLKNIIVDVSDKKPVWSWEGIWYKNGGNSSIGEDRYGSNPQTGVKLEDFVPVSKVTSTIEGNKTDISFDETGFQSFIHFDLDKYKDPIILVKFAPETLDKNNWKPDENNIGKIQLGAEAEAKFREDIGIGFDDFNGYGIRLQATNSMVASHVPYLSLTFSNAPTVTGIYIYEGAE